jgi:subtilisin
MTSSVRSFAILVAVCALTVPPQAQQPPLSTVAATIAPLLQRARSGASVRVIVGVRTPFVPEGTLSVDQALGQRTAIAQAQTSVIDRLATFGAIPRRRFETIPFFAVDVGVAALEQLAAMPDIASIQEDIAEPPLLVESAALIRAPVAWQDGYAGGGWAVAILDTGIDVTHPFFSDRIVSEACYSNAGGGGGQTSVCPGGAVSSTAAGSGDHCPTTFGGCDHGTHVGGIAAGSQYSGGPAMSGIARAASIISVQVFTAFDAGSCGGAPCVLSFISDQIAGLERVYNLRNTYRVAAVNMSLGGGMYSNQSVCDSEQAARKAMFDQLRAAGIATIAASGNNGFATAMGAPACISSAVSVGAVDDGSFGTVADAVSEFSNGAPFLTLLAPGRWITSSVPGGFFEMSGTSMAAPHVTGAWAILKQRKPSAGVHEIFGALVSSGVAVSDARPGGTAHVRIDVGAALDRLRVDYMAMDSPPSDAVVTQPFALNGWALNMSAPIGGGTGVDTLHVWAFPASGSPIFLGAANYGLGRSDVGKVYGSQFTSSGWQLTGRGVPPGMYTLVAYARNTFNGQFSQAAVAERVTVRANPQLWIDTPVADTNVQTTFQIGGWAVDLAAASGTGIDQVQVVAYPNPGSGAAPISLGNASYGFSRSDLGSVFGSQFTNSGFNLTVTTLRGGRYRLVATGHSTVTNSYSVLREVLVTVSEPLISIDSPANGAQVSQPFTIGGWALDRGSQTDTGVDTVHVWAYPDPGSGTAPIFIGEASLGFSRTDVAGAYGSQYLSSGFNIAVGGLTPGHTYRIAVFPHSRLTGTFSVKTVDVMVR